MKTNLFIIFFIGISWNYCKAQYLPMTPIENLNYTNTNSTNEQILIQDSLIYTIRDGGIEDINAYSNIANYYWENYYQVKCIIADTGKTYVFLRNNNYIGRFNKNTHRYENIWPDSLSTLYLYDIGVSSDGKVWAVTKNGINEIRIYDGTTWKKYLPPSLYYYNLGGIKVVNDTTAYVMSNTTFLKFHNGTFDSLYTLPYSYSYEFQDWAADNNGNIWIAANYKLVNVYNGNAMVYDSSNIPTGYVNFNHIKIGTNGHVWISGNSYKLLEYNGGSFYPRTLQYSYYNIENFSLNNQNYPWVITNNNNTPLLQKYNGSTFSTMPFPFMPLRNIKAIGFYTNNYNLYGNFANDEGIFDVYLANNLLPNFSDTSSVTYANDITCFTDNEPSISYDCTFGSHNGVQNISGFVNTLLPSDTINHICYYDGSYYIATNNGLMVYNGILYDVLNTSNSPFPSNKITFVSTGNTNYCNNSNDLYVGTDKGLAVYHNAQWTVYDTSNIHVNSFYVTGATPVCFDTSIYISTKGSGLIEVYTHGSYVLYNISNGNLLDDTLYYVLDAQLGDCGEFIITGTKNHGIAFSGGYIYSLSNFYYDTLYNSYYIRSSTMMAQNMDTYMIGTDSLVYLLSFCGAINNGNIGTGNLISVYPNPATDYLTIEASQPTSIEITNIEGQLIETLATTGNKTTIDVSALAKGMYFVKVKTEKGVAVKKFIKE